MIEKGLNFTAIFGEKYSNLIDGFLRNISLTMPTGRYEILGDSLFAYVFEYNTLEQQEFFENHNEYYDIHYILKGKEIEVYNDQLFLINEKEYDKDNDVSLYKGKGREILVLESEYVIYAPGTAHKTGISVPNFEDKFVKKIVIKVKRSSANE